MDPAAVGQLKRLAAKIEDDTERGRLLEDIRALIAVQERKHPPAAERPLSERLAEAASKTIDDTAQSLKDVGRWFPHRQALTNWLGMLAADPARVLRKAEAALPAALVFGIAWLAEGLSLLLLARPRRRLEEQAQGSLTARLPPIAGRALLRLGAVAVFFMAGIGAFFLLRPDAHLRPVAIQVFAAYIVGRVLLIAARMVLAPSVASLRLVPIGSDAAASLFKWIRRLVLVALTGYLLASTLLLFGLPPRGFSALMNLLILVLLALLILFVLRHRSAVAGWVRGPEEPSAPRSAVSRSLRQGLAAVWHLLTIVYLIGFFVVWWQSIEGGLAYLLRGTLLTVLVALLAGVALHALQRGIDRFKAAENLSAPQRPGLKARAAVYLPVVHAALRAVIWLLAALFILQAWRVSAYQWLGTPAGQRLLGVVLSIALVAAVAVALWEAVNLAIERYLSETERSGRSPAQGARARTLLPLIRKAFLLVLVVMVALIVLSELGIHIGPLLAGAGIIGLAVGFGAQKLVQDIITGVFILLEDAVAVGDVVQVAGIGGLVEELSIRSIRLRDLSGNVHTIPFSSVDTVTNMTKLFSYFVADIGVAYRENTDEVAEVCRDIVEEMRREPEFAADILEPLEVLGVDRFADSAVILKARIKTRPIRQWAVGREFNRRMKKRFDELGIEIPFPHRTLYFGAAKDGSAPPLPLAAAPKQDAQETG
jgi:small conductance mechanosensitive channel